MSDFQLVEPQGWEWDLQSVYSAYLNNFQLHNVPWYDRSWGYMFTSFDTFLSFGWPVICVTDAWTGRPHIVTRTNSIGAFLKTIKTRFGENLPMVDNMLRISPFETQRRHLRTVTDANSYKKVYNTLPATVLAAQKLRVKAGEPKWIQELWDKRDKTFMAVDFEWSERNSSSCLEWGYAALRCSHLDAMGVWPPVPEQNYRKGHYIVAEYVNKVHNKHCPTFPWDYAFGESQVVAKAKLGEIVQATISSLASPDSETIPNQLVLVVHGGAGDLEQLSALKVKLPNNVLMIDTAAFERQLFSKGLRGAMIASQSSKPRQSGTTLSLSNTLRSLNADLGCVWHCSGNDAFGTLLALQLLLDREGTQVPVVQRNKRSSSDGSGRPTTGAGPGQLAAPLTTRASLVPPRPISGYFDDSEAFMHGRDGQRRSPGPGSGTSQKQQQKDEKGQLVLRAGASRLSVVNGVNGSSTDLMKNRLRDSRRQSSGPMETVSQGMSGSKLSMH